MKTVQIIGQTKFVFKTASKQTTKLSNKHTMIYNIHLDYVKHGQDQMTYSFVGHFQ